MARKSVYLRPFAAKRLDKAAIFTIIVKRIFRVAVRSTWSPHKKGLAIKLGGGGRKNGWADIG